MRRHRLRSVVWALSALLIAACEGPTAEGELGTTSQPVAIQKVYTRKIFVHMMPWFQVGGQHWTMNNRNSATGIASYSSPMIGEYSSNDGNVIEYQLLTMKYAGIDGVLVDWPGLSGAFDLPQNKANSDAIINRTAAFGLDFGIVYEDQNAGSVDAAKADMAYVQDNFLSKPNFIKVSGAPAVLVFGPQKFVNPSDWTTILSAFPQKPKFFALWYNNDAGSNADGKFAWLAQNAVKGISDFDNGLDGVNHGLMIPVLYPGFNPYYAQGGWPGPTYKISYTLKTDNTEGGDTLTSTFELGKYVGDTLQIATWNDYGEGTMIEPTNQFQYQFLTTLQKSVGAVYTDAELKIVKMLFDQRKQFGASKQADLDKASAALANLDVATACTVLGCTVPVHVGTGGASGSGGASGAGGTSGAGGASGSGGAKAGSGGRSGSGGASSSVDASMPASTGGKSGNDAGAPGATGDNGHAGGCAVAGLEEVDPSAWKWMWTAAVGGLACVLATRRRRARRT